MQELVEEIAYEMNDFMMETQETVNEERLQIIKDSGADIEIIELTPEEREVFREAAMPAREVFRNSVGEKGNKILDIMEEDSEKLLKERYGDS